MTQSHEQSEWEEPCSKSPLTDSLIIVKQIMFSLFAPHIASDVFNLTSFSVVSDPLGCETIEWNMDDEDVGEYIDKVVMNEHGIYVRMYIEGMSAQTLAIIIDNDILQTKYVVHMAYSIGLSSTSIGESLHIVIENVTKNMGTSWIDASLSQYETTIHINDGSDSHSYGTWTSTIEPDNVTVELDCEIVNNSNSIIVSKCTSYTYWPKSVFNRIPMCNQIGVNFGYDQDTNRALFGTKYFSIEGAIPSGWNKYNVTGNGSNLTFGDQYTIKDLPESFVSYWVNMGAEVWMGGDDFKQSMLVPPDT